MNMTTSLDNIPMKTTGGERTDDSDDPVVKDILNEFQQELKVNTGGNAYEINYEQQPPPQVAASYVRPQPTQVKQQIQSRPDMHKSYYNEEYARKTAIIIIIVGVIFSPIIFDLIVERVPNSMMGIFTSYDFYIKSFIAFIAIYLLYLYKVI